MAIRFLNGQTVDGALTVSGNVQGATFNGLAINTSLTNNVANEIVRTQGNGYVNFGWINSISGNHTGTITRITASNDAYLRYVTPAQFRVGVTDGYYAPVSTVTGVTSIATTNGITGGTIISTGTIQVDSTVIRTTGGQTIANVTTLDDLDVIDTLAWRVSSTDAARQRADARDDATTFSRLHWFGKSDTAGTSNFRHAYYDGANYINVTAASGAVTFDGILAATGGTSTEWNTSYDNSITGLAVTGTTTKTLTATQQDGGTLTASWTDNDSNTTWPNVGAGIRTNYDLGFKPPVNAYAGFSFQTETGTGAGYFLIRGGGASGAYTDQGISLIADAGWLSLVSRTTTDKGVRIMAGATATTRLTVTSAGHTTVTGIFGAPSSSGSASEGILRLSQSSGVGSMYMGFGDPYAWIQSRSSSDYSLNYALALNPNGGNVGIGTTTPGAQLHNYSTATTNVFITGYGTAAQNDWGAQNAMFVKTDNGLLISKQNANNNTNRLFNFYNDSNGYAQLYMYTGGNTPQVQIKTSGNSYFNGGNVGINTTVFPSSGFAKFVVNGGAIAARPAGVNDYFSYIKSNWALDNAFEIGIEGAGTQHRFITSGNYYYGTELRFWTSDTIRMTINSSGNVGIGVTGPLSKLQIIANQSAASPGAKNYTGSAINADGGDIATGRVFFQGSSSGATDMCGINNETSRIVLYNYTDGRYLQYWDHAGSSFIPNGNLGVGTTVNGTRNEKLFVDGEVRQQTTIGENPLGATRGGLGAYDNTAGWGAGIGGQLVLGYIYTGTTGYTEGALIKMYKENSTQGHYGSGLRWSVRENGTNLTPKMQLNPSGNLSIGSTAGSAAKLYVEGSSAINAARFYGTGGTVAPLELRQNNTAGWFAKFYSDNFGTYVGGISFYGSTTTFSTSSDYRLKENIIPISDSITRLKQLKPSRFNFKQYPEITIDGFLAHEVQDIVPEAVTGDKDELDLSGKPVYQAIDHSRLIPLLVASIQELELRVKELENK
jgi:hypothetical protein